MTDSTQDTKSHVHLRYRPDIDGIRAIAVLLVVFDHLKTRFSGGFVGVDVFFVISGYLISATILSDFRKGTFSLAAFYERRIRRIAPALLVVLLVTSILTYKCFTPEETISSAKVALGALLSVSNVVLWTQSDYFDAASSTKPLLHTWSLGIEEQFYFIFPLLILVVWMFWRKNIRWVISGIAAASLLFAIWTVRQSPSSAFYLIPFRAWELLLGTIISQNYIPKPKSVVARNLASGAGLLMILIPALMYTGDTLFPGLSAIPPCLGAALIIIAGENGTSLIGRVLSTRPVTFIGKISYSLYLWHWPIIVFQTTNRLFFLSTSGGHSFLKPKLLLLSLVAGTLSWLFIEQPFRTGRMRPSRGRLFLITGSATAVAVAIIVATFATDGFASRFPASVTRMATYSTKYIDPQWDAGRCFLTSRQEGKTIDFASCVQPGNGHQSLLLIGDSHAADLWPGLKSTLTDYDVRELTVSGCRPLMNSKESRFQRCAQVYKFLFDDFLPNHHVDIVLLSGRWGSDELPELGKEVQWLQSHGIRPIVVGPSPEFDVPMPHLLATSLRQHEHTIDLSSYQDAEREPLDTQMSQLAASKWHVEYISIYKTECHDGCPLWAAPNVPLFFDREHFTPEASRSVVLDWKAAGLL
jgi:peptidoglycan/LPS O-acetylase OafA/YrhL